MDETEKERQREEQSECDSVINNLSPLHHRYILWYRTLQHNTDSSSGRTFRQSSSHFSYFLTHSTDGHVLHTSLLISKQWNCTGNKSCSIQLARFISSIRGSSVTYMKSKWGNNNTRDRRRVIEWGHVRRLNRWAAWKTLTSIESERANSPQWALPLPGSSEKFIRGTSYWAYSKDREALSISRCCCHVKGHQQAVHLNANTLFTLLSTRTGILSTFLNCTVSREFLTFVFGPVSNFSSSFQILTWSLVFFLSQAAYKVLGCQTVLRICPT